MPDDPPSNWRQALSWKTAIDGRDRETVSLIRALFIELYEATGRYPLVEELLAALRQPGS